MLREVSTAGSFAVCASYRPGLTLQHGPILGVGVLFLTVARVVLFLLAHLEPLFKAIPPVQQLALDRLWLAALTDKKNWSVIRLVQCRGRGFCALIRCCSIHGVEYFGPGHQY